MPDGYWIACRERLPQTLIQELVNMLLLLSTPFGARQAHKHQEQSFRLSDLVRIIAIELASRGLLSQPGKLFRRPAWHKSHNQL